MRPEGGAGGQAGNIQDPLRRRRTSGRAGGRTDNLSGTGEEGKKREGREWGGEAERRELPKQYVDHPTGEREGREERREGGVSLQSLPYLPFVCKQPLH